MVGAGIRILESFSVAASGCDPPVPSMVGHDGVEAVPCSEGDWHPEGGVSQSREVSRRPL